MNKKAYINYEKAVNAGKNFKVVDFEVTEGDLKGGLVQIKEVDGVGLCEIMETIEAHERLIKTLMHGLANPKPLDKEDASEMIKNNFESFNEIGAEILILAGI